MTTKMRVAQWTVYFFAVVMLIWVLAAIIEKVLQAAGYAIAPLLP